MTDLELYEPPTGDSPIMQALAVAEPAARLIEQIVRTNFVPAAYRGKPAEALACVLTGDMLGLHPLVALREIDVIQGTPAYSAKMQRALVQRAGHRMWLEESTALTCTMAGHRRDDAEHVQRVTWTIDRAQKLNLTGKQNWRQQPTAMLIARCTGELARLLAADELLGLAYNADEVRDGTASDEEVVDAVPADVVTEAPEGTAPAPKPQNRRSIAKKAAGKAPAAAPAPKPRAANPVDDFDEIDGVAAGPTTPPPAAAPSDDGDDLAKRRAQMLSIRIRETLGEVDRDARLRFVSASLGEPITTTKALSSEQVDRVLVDLDQMKAGRLEWDGETLTTVAELVDDEAPADAPSPAATDSGWAALDAEDWRELVKQKGLRVGDVLRQANAIASELGVDAPASAAGIAEADLVLRDRLGAWIDNGGQA
jgi:hypothetical protein